MQKYQALGQRDSSSDESGQNRIGFLSHTKEINNFEYDEPQQARWQRRRGTWYRAALVVSWIFVLALLVSLKFSDVALDMLGFDGSERPSEKALVLASYSKQNTSWLDDIPSDWKIYKYNLDDPMPSSHLTVPRNQGREAMAYLTFILNHYDRLPRYTVFLHGHARSWHQAEPIAWKVRALNLDLLKHEGYINFRCGLKPGCSADTVLGAAHPEPRDHPLVRQIMPAFWKEMYQPKHGRWDLGPYPAEVGQPCCAQFGVTRESILARTKEFYAAYRRPMERDVREYKKIFGDLWDGYRMGILYEHLWHVVFGKEPLLCPDAEFCRAMYFGDQIRCANYTGDYEHSRGWGKIACSNIWDDEVVRVETAEQDQYGGWDGVKDPGFVEAWLEDVGVDETSDEIKKDVNIAKTVRQMGHISICEEDIIEGKVQFALSTAPNHVEPLSSELQKFVSSPRPDHASEASVIRRLNDSTVDERNVSRSTQ